MATHKHIVDALTPEQKKIKYGTKVKIINPDKASWWRRGRKTEGTVIRVVDRLQGELQQDRERNNIQNILPSLKDFEDQEGRYLTIQTSTTSMAITRIDNVEEIS